MTALWKEDTTEAAVLVALALLHLDPAEAVVADVGANRGLFAFAFADAGFVNVHAYEPEPAAIAEFEAARNEHPRSRSGVRLHCVAVSDAHGAAMLQTAVISRVATLDRKFTASHSPELYNGATRVLCAPLTMPRIDVLKVDVEGHELAVLKGMRDHTAARPRLLMYELHADSPDYDELENLVALLGYADGMAFVKREGELVRMVRTDEMWAFRKPGHYFNIIRFKD